MKSRKKILYIVRYPAYEDFNLRGKFDGQLEAFRKLNMDVYYLTFDRESFYLVHNDERERVGRAAVCFPLYFHTMVYGDMHRAVLKTVKKIHFDYVYWRSAPVWYSSYRVGKVLHEMGTKIIYEIPTYCNGGETDMSLPRRLFRLYARLWEEKLMRYPDMFIFTGDAEFLTFHGKPVVNIDNGIHAETMPVRRPERKADEVHILALASMSYWHGYDRLLRSLGEYSGEKRVIVHMVGGNDGGMLTQWKELAGKLRLEDSVIFHGKMYGAELEEMFNLCDVGINSLGLYRKNLEATSELKIREYTARGLPFVCAVEDPALQYAEEPFWMAVPNDDTVPDMGEIVGFALKMRLDGEHPSKMRDYALKHMTWEGQYASVFERFAKE